MEPVDRTRGEYSGVHISNQVIDDRFGYVRPSRQLLDFYRKKIAQYENEHDSLTKKLSEYSTSHEDEHQIECEVRQREEEIAELQKALSDMQVFLFTEREQVLKLYTENDSFKARDLENKRTIQQLLALRGGACDGEISYFFREPPQQPIISDKTKYKDVHNQKLQSAQRRKQRDGERGRERPPPNRLKELEEPDQVTLRLQVEALQSQISDQARWAQEFIEALNEDKRIKQEEHETRRERDLQKVKIITQKLHKTQDLLYESTQDTLKLRTGWQQTESRWITEKDRLILDLDKCRGRLNVDRQAHPAADGNISNNAAAGVSKSAVDRSALTIDSTAQYRLEAKKLRVELENTAHMSEMYREQVISLEDEIASYREKEHLKTDVYKDKTENMSKRYDIMKQRYSDLEKRRNLEVEGFKNDIKSLRRQLKDMEKQLYKATVQFGGSVLEHRPADVDLAVLHQVKKTSARSLKLNDQLKGVKRRVYSLEEDMKHL